MAGVRHCEELGKNLRKITLRLLDNQQLIKLLYYTDKEPLNQADLTEEQKNEILAKRLISLIPQNNPVETAHSKIVIQVADGSKINTNTDFRDIILNFNVYTPITQWIIKDENLRPFLIMGQIEESLDGKNINGLGKLVSGDFHLIQNTEQMTVYRFTFYITDFA